MNMLLVLDDVEYICKLMYESFKVPVFFIDEKGEVKLEFSSNYIHNPLYPSKKDVLHQLFNPDDPHQFPVLKSTNYMENFFSVSLRKDNLFKGTFLVGPSIYSKPSKDMLKGIIADLNISKEKHDVIHYYQSLPVLSNSRLIHASMLLYYMIYHEKLDTTMILQQNKSLENNPIEIENADVDISNRRQSMSFHHDPLYEKKLFQCIKEGRKEELIQHLKLSPETGELGILSKRSHLRSQKNLGISAITLATRFAMEGGLHPEVAYTLSDLYIQNLEELKESKAVTTLLDEALCDFADRVQESKTYQYSKSISACQNYIFTHLYEDISLSDLASVAAMHPNYLSALFKKEVGISLREYIQRARVEEAKNLITFTNYSLSEIYTLLNFHDQSYFTKIFKKFTGVTPRCFKNKQMKT